MKRRLAWCTLAAACCLLMLRPHTEPPPADPPPAEPPPAPRGVLRLEAYSPAAAHSAALLPPCPRRTLRQPHPEAASEGRLKLLRAYEDLRSPSLPTVRVLAVLDGPEKPPPLYCHLWSQGRLVAASKATLQEIWWPAWDADRNGSFSRPFLLSCAYGEASLRPDRASVGGGGPCVASTEQVAVQPFSKRGVARGSVAVCVKGLDFPPDERLAPRLLEWAEANRLLGATRLRLYWRRPPTQPAVRRALRHLRRAADVDVLHSLHALRTDEQLDLWQRRRLDVLDLTDCLYRSVGRHQFVLSLDIDEVLVPVADSSWQGLLSKLSAEVERYASLSVQNYFFFARQNESLLDVTWRSANLTQDAVKSFVPTANALTLFNHYALHSLVPGVLPRLTLDTSVAQVNHYRQGCSVFLGNDCKENYQRFGQRDTILVDKIGKKLKERVKSAMLEKSDFAMNEI